jgi:hypothetical protein
MSDLNARILALEKLVAKYEKSRADFMAIQEELRTLTPSVKLDEVLAANIATLASTERMLGMTRERLERERALARSSGESMSPFARTGSSFA